MNKKEEAIHWLESWLNLCKTGGKKLRPTHNCITCKLQNGDAAQAECREYADLFRSLCEKL